MKVCCRESLAGESWSRTAGPVGSQQQLRAVDTSRGLCKAPAQRAMCSPSGCNPAPRSNPEPGHLKRPTSQRIPHTAAAHIQHVYTWTDAGTALWLVDRKCLVVEWQLSGMSLCLGSVIHFTEGSSYTGGASNTNYGSFPFMEQG